MFNPTLATRPSFTVLRSISFPALLNNLVTRSTGSYHANQAGNLDSMLPGVRVTAGLGFFLCSGCLGDSEDSDSLLQKDLASS